MVRVDAVTQVRARAAASSFFGAGEPVAYAAAHGCLDVLGALEAEGGGTLAQVVLPGGGAGGVGGGGDGLLRVRSGQIAQGEAEVRVGEWLGLSREDVARRLM